MFFKKRNDTMVPKDLHNKGAYFQIVLDNDKSVIFMPLDCFIQKGKLARMAASIAPAGFERVRKQGKGREGKGKEGKKRNKGWK